MNEIEEACSRLRDEKVELQQRYDALYADSMIAHRWFAKQFGEIMNGRDFAVKCPMASDQINGVYEKIDELQDVLATNLEARTILGLLSR